jgi:cation transport ATPase
MKRSLLALALALCATSSLAAGAAPSYTKVEFFGLNCTVCEDGLKDKFEQFPGVSRATVDMSSFTVCLRTSPGAAPAQNDIKSTLQSVGFNLVKVEAAAKC